MRLGVPLLDDLLFGPEPPRPAPPPPDPPPPPPVAPPEPVAAPEPAPPPKRPKLKPWDVRKKKKGRG